jgi:hypothetical protein
MGKRSRKRVGTGEHRAQPAGPAASTSVSSRAGASRATATGRVPRGRTGQRIQTRPRPLWHPWPLTEVALGLGVAIAAVGFIRGLDRGAALIGAGVLMATIGVIELCAREHFSGFKSHTLLLAFLPVVALHTVVALWLVDGYRGPVALLVDIGLFGLLAMVMLDRFRQARPARTGAR